jgi:hypothetical protein
MTTADFCPKCGSPKTNANSEFCGQCGAFLPRIILVCCPGCGKPRKNANAEFCGECGAAYAKPDPSQKGESNVNTGPKSPTSTSGHHDVFISYSSKDKPIADAVCASLEYNAIRCWIAPRDVLPGEDFPKAIINGINESKIMVLIFSANANASPHVTREVTKAVGKGIIIIPFRIEDAPMSESMEYLIGLPHWLDALTSPMEQHIDTLSRRVKTLVEDHK